MLQRINLVPKVPLSVKLHRLLPLLLVLTLLLTGAVIYGENLRLGKRMALLAAEIAEMESAARQAEALQAAVQQLNVRVERARKARDEAAEEAARLARPLLEKPLFSAVLAEISQVMPPSIRCDKITLRSDGGTISGLAVQYQELPQMVSALRRNPRFAEATLQGIDRGGERADSPFLFTIIFQLTPRG